MALYRVTVPRIHIESIRSAHKDSLFATMSIRVMNPNGGLHRDYPAKTLSLGDHGAKEELRPNFGFPEIDVPDPAAGAPDGGAVYMVFMLANAGHTPSGFVDVLNNAANAFTGALAGKLLEAGGLSLATVGALAATLGVQEVVNLLTANCDGMVVSESFAWTGLQLHRTALPGKTWETVRGYPGTDSPSGCGDNSKYDVAYDITLVPAPPIGGKPPPPIINH